MTIGNQEVKFGPKQRSNPTPKRVEFICDLLAKVFSGVAGLLTVMGFVSNDVSNLVGGIVNLILIPVVLEIKKYFGVQLPMKKVPVEDVEVVDTQKN